MPRLAALAAARAMGWGRVLLGGAAHLDAADEAVLGTGGPLGGEGALDAEGGGFGVGVREAGLRLPDAGGDSRWRRGEALAGLVECGGGGAFGDLLLGVAAVEFENAAGGGEQIAVEEDSESAADDEVFVGRPGEAEAD